MYIVCVCIVTLLPSTAIVEAHETSGAAVSWWHGWRNTLNRWGMTPYATYTTALLGNPVGGQRHGFEYSGDLDFGVALDLEKLWGLHGLVLRTSGSWRSGRDLSTQAIGNIFTAAHNVGGTTIRLHNLHLEQVLFDNHLSLLCGRAGMGDEFLTSPVYEKFVQAAFNGNVFSITANLPSFTSHPHATWGLRTRVEPNDNWSVMAGAYYSDASLLDNETHGVDFSFRDDAGVTLIGQIGYRFHQGPQVSGLPGNYAIGGYYDSGSFSDFSRSQQKETNGNYTLYLMLDQMIYRDGGPHTDQGLTLFLTAAFAPEQDRNTFPYFFSGGLIYQGLLPGRENDSTGFGLAYGSLSKHLHYQDFEQDFEMVLELNYAISLSPWLTVQPDVQYIMNPAGLDNVPDAVVIGVHIIVNL